MNICCCCFPLLSRLFPRCQTFFSLQKSTIFTNFYDSYEPTKQFRIQFHEKLMQTPTKAENRFLFLLFLPTKGGASYSPEYYINIRTGIHYFPKGNTTIDPNNRFKSGLNRIEEKNDEVKWKLFDFNYLLGRISHRIDIENLINDASRRLFLMVLKQLRLEWNNKNFPIGLNSKACLRDDKKVFELFFFYSLIKKQMRRILISFSLRIFIVNILSVECSLNIHTL